MSISGDEAKVSGRTSARALAVVARFRGVRGSLLQFRRARVRLEARSLRLALPAAACGAHGLLWSATSLATSRDALKQAHLWGARCAPSWPGTQGWRRERSAGRGKHRCRGACVKEMGPRWWLPLRVPASPPPARLLSLPYFLLPPFLPLFLFLSPSLSFVSRKQNCGENSGNRDCTHLKEIFTFVSHERDGRLFQDERAQSQRKSTLKSLRKFLTTPIPSLYNKCSCDKSIWQ